MPVFIRNGNYHLDQVDIYGNGAIEAWGKFDLPGFHRKLEERWVESQVRIGKPLSVFNLGGTVVTEAHWIMSAGDLWNKVHESLAALATADQNTFKMPLKKPELPEGVHDWSMVRFRPSPYKTGTSGEFIPGEKVPIFIQINGQPVLTSLFLYADETCRVGNSGEFHPLKHAADAFETGELRTSVADEERICILHLGVIRGTRGAWPVEPRERVKEIYDLVNGLQGQPESRTVCDEAYRRYNDSPSNRNREALAAAYEAVPKHLRRFCGDMDWKDGPIKRALGLD